MGRRLERSSFGSTTSVSAGNDPTQISELISRLESNAKVFNLKFSEPEDFNAENARTPKEDVEFIGVFAEYDEQRKCRVWKHTEKKYKKLEELEEFLVKHVDTSGKDCKLTPRAIQCVVGNAIWDCMVSLRSLYEVYDLIGLGQCLIATTDKTRVKWDTPVIVSQSSLSTLINAVRTILSTKVVGYSIKSIPKEDLEVVHVCTDASMDFGGFSVLSSKGVKFCHSEKVVFPPEAVRDNWNINLLELWTAIYVIDKFKDKMLILGIDSAVARAWLRRETASGVGRDTAIELLKKLPKESKFRTILLYSEDNLADIPSRDGLTKRIGEQERYLASWQIMTGTHFYLHTCNKVKAGVDRRIRVALEDLTSLELDKAKRGWERWTHQGVCVNDPTLDPSVGTSVAEFVDSDEDDEDSEEESEKEECGSVVETDRGKRGRDDVQPTP